MGNRFLNAILTLAATNICAWGQSTSWQDLRMPSDGYVSALEHSGSALFAGMGSGRIFRSTNDGLTWTKVAGMGTAPVRKFLFQDSVYLAASGDLVDRGMIDCQLPVSCIDPASLGGLYTSTDQGKSWATGSLRAVTALASDGHDLYAATLAGWFRSTDYGRQWKPLVPSLLPGANLGAFGTVAVHGMEYLGGKLYVRTSYDLFQGTFKGDTVFLTASLAGVGSLAAMPPYLFASTPGQLKRTQDGIHWEAIANQEFPILSVSGKKLLGVTADLAGIRESSDSGKTWLTLPVPPRNAFSLCAHGSFLFEGFQAEGVSVLRNRGGAWEASGPGLYDFWVTGMILDRGAPLALVEGIGLLQGSGSDAPTWRKTLGNSWSGAMLAGAEGDAIYLDGYSLWASRAGKPEAWDSLAACPKCQAVVAGKGWQAAFLSDNSILLCETGNKCVTLPRDRLPQAFDVWPIGTRLVNGFRSGAAHGDTLMVALDSLYRSSDRGRTWSLLGPLPGYEPVLGYGSGIWRLAFGKTVVRGDLSAPSGILSSSHDGGLTWQQDHPDDLNPIAKVMAFRYGETYLGTPTGVYLFRDGATAWQKLGSGPSEFNVLSLAVEGNQLVAGLASGEVLGWKLETVGIRAEGRGPSAKSRPQTGLQISRQKGLIQSGGIPLSGAWRRLDGRFADWTPGLAKKSISP